MKNLIVDAGPLIALFDKTDQYHELVYNYMMNFHGQLITTWPVITEVLHMIDFNVNVQVDFMLWVKSGGINIIDIKAHEITRIIELTNKYSNVPMDLADGSLIILSERYKLKEVLSIDSDFYIYRTMKNDYLTNVLNM